MELKDFFEPHIERTGDPEGQQQRRRVAASLERDDGLACYAGPSGEVFLGHLAALESQAPDRVPNGDQSGRHY